MADEKESKKVPTSWWDFKMQALQYGLFFAGGIVLILAFIFGCASQIASNITDVVNLGNHCAAGAGVRMIQLSGLILGVAGVLLDLATVRLVLNMGTMLQEGFGFGIGIETAWTIIRNLVNLAFIGGLVWVAISLIMGDSVSGQKPGKLVVGIIIGALLVNFSYFFAGVVIDASNFVTRAIYQEAFFGTTELNAARGDRAARDRDEPSNTSLTPGEPIKNLFRQGADQITNGTISGRFMLATRLGTISTKDEIPENARDIGMEILLVGLVGGAVLISAAVIFLQFTILLTGRFVVIIILLITSPIGILRFTSIPSLAEYGKGWWNALISQALFPPLFFLLTASALTVTETGAKELLKGTNGTLVDFFKNPVSKGVSGADGLEKFYNQFDLLLLFVIATMLLYVALRVASNVAEQAPVSVPTTKEIYQFRKDLMKNGVKGAQTAFKAGGTVLAAPGRIPVSWVNWALPSRLKLKEFDEAGRPLNTLWDSISNAPSRRANTPPGPFASAQQRAEAALANKLFDAFMNPLNLIVGKGGLNDQIKTAEQELEDAKKRGDEKATAEADKKLTALRSQKESRLDEAAEGFANLDPETQKNLRARNWGDGFDDFRDVDRRAKRTRIAGATAQTTKTSTVQKTENGAASSPQQPPTENSGSDAVVAAIMAQGDKERLRDLQTLEYTRSLIDALIKRAPDFKVNDLGAVYRGGISNSEFWEIHDATTKETRDGFRAGPGKYAKRPVSEAEAQARSK